MTKAVLLCGVAINKCAESPLIEQRFNDGVPGTFRVFDRAFEAPVPNLYAQDFQFRLASQASAVAMFSLWFGLIV